MILSIIRGLFSRKPAAPVTREDAATYGYRTAAEFFFTSRTAQTGVVVLSMHELAELLQAAYVDGMTDMVGMVENSTRLQ